MRRHSLVGVAAGAGLLLVYMGIMTLAEGPRAGVEQARQLWYWVLPLAVGFGGQAGLFSFVRQGFRERHRAATASVATSGGISTGSMVACCAHHLSDVLPLLGLSGLALFLVRYQVVFIIAGLLSNAVGLAIMLETIQRHGLSPRVAGWRVDWGVTKKVVLLSSAPILLAAFLFTVG